MPSRAMIHTGRSLFEIDDVGQEIPEDHVSIGQHLQKYGYKSFHTGKWHNGSDGFDRSFQDGADIFFGGMGDPYNLPLSNYDPSGEYSHRVPSNIDPFTGKSQRVHIGDHTTNGCHATDVFVDTACSFVENQQEDSEPFFLSIALTAPHDPRNAPATYHEKHQAEQTAVPPNFMVYHPFDTGDLHLRDEQLAQHPRNPQEIQEHIADYHAMISHLDDGFGKLRKALEATGQFENTIIVFTADHGIAIGQHGLMGKQCLYDHSLRIPLIITGPGVPKNQDIDQLVRHFDIFPTLCDLAGIDTPDSVTSESLLPQLEEHTATTDTLYLAYRKSIRGILAGKWKLIEYATPGYRGTQLFNLSSDPHECVNKAALPECADKLKELRNILLEKSKSSGDRQHRYGKDFWAHYERACN